MAEHDTKIVALKWKLSLLFLASKNTLSRLTLKTEVKENTPVLANHSHIRTGPGMRPNFMSSDIHPLQLPSSGQKLLQKDHDCFEI